MMAETDGNYLGQPSRPVEDLKPDTPRPEIDRSGTRQRPSWRSYALGDEAVIIPIDLSERPEVLEMAAKLGLTFSKGSEIRPEYIYGHGRPEVSGR